MGRIDMHVDTSQNCGEGQQQNSDCHMSSDSRQAGCRWRRAFCALCVLCIVTLLLALFGNPQWHRFIYVFQEHYATNILGDWVRPKVGSSYTGIWYSWHKDGRLREMTFYRGGVEDGASLTFDDSGQVTDYRNYKQGRLHGMMVDLSDPKRICSFKSGIKHGVFLQYSWGGDSATLQTWKNGKPWTGTFEVQILDADGGTRIDEVQYQQGQIHGEYKNATIVF